MNVGPLYAKVRECLKKFIVLQGGTSSAKTVTTLQYLVTYAIEHANSVITVVGQDIPNLKKGAIRDFQLFVESDPEIAAQIVSYNQTDRIYHFRNGSIIEFNSYKDEQDAKSGKRDVLFVNEANGIAYMVFWQLQRRTRKKVIIDYNPNSEFWAHEKLLSGADKEFPKSKVQLFITDHRHNPFLTPDEHESLENISDPDLFKVYARGLTGKIKGLIFGHFRKVKEPPEVYDRIIWGIDYGYTNDPTALVKIWCVGRKRYCKEICYTPGLPAETIKTLLESNGYDGEQDIFSEADPNMINDLRLLGLGVQPAIKGPGSIIAGISKVRQHECFMVIEEEQAEKTNFEKEVDNYKWVMAQDMATGKEVMTNQPIDAWNHLCDASRMAIYTDSFRNR
jgi:phage terminase large subunit